MGAAAPTAAASVGSFSSSLVHLLHAAQPPLPSGLLHLSPHAAAALYWLSLAQDTRGRRRAAAGSGGAMDHFVFVQDLHVAAWRHVGIQQQITKAEAELRADATAVWLRGMQLANCCALQNLVTAVRRSRTGVPVFKTVTCGRVVLATAITIHMALLHASPFAASSCRR